MFLDGYIVGIAWLDVTRCGELDHEGILFLSIELAKPDVSQMNGNAPSRR